MDDEAPAEGSQEGAEEEGGGVDTAHVTARHVLCESGPLFVVSYHEGQGCYLGGTSLEGQGAATWGVLA